MIFFEKKVCRMRRKSHNDLLNELINHLDEMHNEDLEDFKELKQGLKELKSQIKYKNH